MQEPQRTPALNEVVAQEIWNCGWSRPATQRVWMDGTPAPVWVCARLGGERRWSDTSARCVPIGFTSSPGDPGSSGRCTEDCSWPSTPNVTC